MRDARRRGGAARRLIVAGLLTALIGLAILLAQAIRVLDPGIALSLSGFTLGFGGALVGVIGVVSRP